MLGLPVSRADRARLVRLDRPGNRRAPPRPARPRRRHTRTDRSRPDVGRARLRTSPRGQRARSSNLRRRRSPAGLGLSQIYRSRSTGMGSSKRPPFLRSRRWIRWPRKSIRRASWRFATSRKRRTSLAPRKIPIRGACFWHGRSIPSPKRKSLQPPQEGYIVRFFRTCAMCRFQEWSRDAAADESASAGRAARQEFARRGRRLRNGEGPDRRP